jgi:lipoate-protein ligase A
MLFVDNQGITDPYINLAIEEHLMRNLETQEVILLFYINEPSVIIGRHQNPFEEINRDYVEEQGIHVVRRLSGGGAVYHDLGNLNFSFITTNTHKNFHNFRKFTQPVIRVIKQLGAPAELSGSSDIQVKGRKVSGNAQYATAKRLVTHGTLLFNSDLKQVAEALRVKPGKISSKSIKSVRSQVTNIQDYLDQPMNIQAFRERLLKGIFAGEQPIPRYVLKESDWESIHMLEFERYRTWEWNYGRSPDFNVQRTQRFTGTEISVQIDVQKGVIKGIRFSGEFYSPKDIAELESSLIGVRYYGAHLAEALESLKGGNYFPNLSKKALLKLLY